MRRVPILMTRELKTYFQSPLAYILACLYTVLILLLAGHPGLDRGPKEMLPGLIGLSAFLMIFLVPILTMRLLSEEKASGSMEVLVTDPVTDWDIVLGKFLAGVLALWAMLLPLGLYVAIYALVGKGNEAAGVPGYKLWEWLPACMEWGPVFTGLAGLALLGTLFVAAGLFASSLTRNQAISALVGFAMTLVLWVFGLLEQFVDTSKWHEWIGSLSLLDRLRLMVDGRFDTRAIFLFASTTILLLYLTVRVVESRKWR